MANKLGDNAEFSEININDSKSLQEALKDVDLGVHTAGPFQQAQNLTVLEASIQNKTAYLDVCDDTSYSVRAKSYMERAKDANVPAITTGGIYPGVSNGSVAFSLNLPEVRSIHEVLGVPTVSARFGTSPFFWNWGIAAMTYLLPAETLRD